VCAAGDAGRYIAVESREPMSELLELRKELEETKSKLRRLEDLQNIFRVWVRLRQKLFPSNCSGVDVRGIDLVMLDSDVAGCVSTFLTRGQLDQRQKEYLYFCDECLDVVNRELQAYEGWYFRQLKALTSAIIEFQRKW
jgi:hypothetical protein